MNPIAFSTLLWLTVIGSSSIAAGLASLTRRKEPGLVEALIFQLVSATTSILLAVTIGSISILGLQRIPIHVLEEATLPAIPLSLLVYLVDKAYEAHKYLGFRSKSFIELAVIALVAAPIAEELVFRGLIEGYLLAQGTSTIIAIVLPAILFTVSHILSYTSPRTRKPPATYVALQALYALLAGLLTSYYREATGSILPTIIIHTTINLGGLIAQRQLIKKHTEIGGLKLNQIL